MMIKQQKTEIEDLRVEINSLKTVIQKILPEN